jgi:hypothetical protein
MLEASWRLDASSWVLDVDIDEQVAFPGILGASGDAAESTQANAIAAGDSIVANDGGGGESALQPFLDFLDASNITVVRGTLIDRVARGGCITDVRVTPTLAVQFPLRCTLTRDVVRGCR